MTDNKLMVLPDVQSSADRRNIPIRRVGVKGIRTPILVKSQSGAQHTVADVEMYVSLPADKKGTHMSRFWTLLGGINKPFAPQMMEVIAPVTSLCPCSKEISKYGAHNQRSHVSITAELETNFPIEKQIEMIESCASCQVWGLLKRSDEKYVTEHAYENPKFVEDLVRDVAIRCQDEPAILAFTVEAENFESIHNHSAFASLHFDKRQTAE